MDRTRRILLITIGILFLVLVGLLVGHRLFMAEPPTPTNSTSAAFVENSMIVDPSLTKTSDIDDLLNQAKKLSMDQNPDYVSALRALITAFRKNPSEDQIKVIKNMFPSLLENLKRQDVVNNIKRDYTEFDQFNKLLFKEESANSGEIEEMIRTAQTLAFEGKYDQAIENLENAKQFQPTSEQGKRIQSLINDYLKRLEERIIEKTSDIKESVNTNLANSETEPREGDPTKPSYDFNGGNDKQDLASSKNRPNDTSNPAYNYSDKENTSRYVPEDTTPRKPKRTHSDQRNQLKSKPVKTTPTLKKLPEPEKELTPKEAEKNVTKLITDKNHSIGDILKNPGASKQWTDFGIEENKQGKYDRAQGYFKKALDANPNESKALSHLSTAQLRLEDYTKAEKNAKQALNLDPNDANANLVLGEVAYKNDRFDEALRLLDKTIQLDPFNVIAHYREGVIYLLNQNYSKAKTAFQNAIDYYNPATQEEATRLMIPCYAHYNLAMVYFKSSNAQKALLEIDEALNFQPRHDKSLILKGQIHYINALDTDNANDYQEALTALRSAVRHHPNNFYAQFLLGKTYDKIGNFSQAVESYKKAFQNDETNYEAAFNLARSYSRLGKHKDAVTYFDKAYKIDHTDVALYIELGQSLQKMNQMDRALSTYEQGFQVDSTNKELYYALIDLYASQKKYDQALRVIKLAEKNQVESMDLLIKEAEMQYLLKQFPDAIQCYQKLVKNHPENIAYRLQLARSLYRTQKNTDALNEVDWILMRQPNHSEASKLKTQIESNS